MQEITLVNFTMSLTPDGHIKYEIKDVPSEEFRSAMNERAPDYPTTDKIANSMEYLVGELNLLCNKLEDLPL